MSTSYLSGDEIDRMKADAISRARQMRSRSTLPFSQQSKETKSRQSTQSENENFKKTPSAQKRLSGVESIIQMTKMMGLESDRLILFALILLLSGEEDNFPIILALLYIAM